MVFFISVNLSSAVTPTPSSAPTVACGACNRTMTLMFTSDYYASENSWTLKPQGPFSQCTHNVSKAYPNSLENEYSNTPVEVLYEYSLGHLCAFKSYTFTFFDSAGDGCTSAEFGQGHWELYVDYNLDGTTLVGSSDCDFASSTSLTFTVPAPPHASLSPSPVPSALPTHSALPSPLPTPSPSPLPTSPTLSPSPAPRQCGACNQTLSLDLFTDAHGNEITWTLEPLKHAVGCAVNVTYSGGPFPNYSEGHLNTVVLSKQICAFQGYRFTLQDSFGDGMKVFDAGSATLGYYTLTLSGSEVASGTGNFTTEASSDFLASLAPTLAPTPLPTTTPTLPPTLHPVPNPTALPTQHPSLTQHPSRQPTWAPTLAPSLSPSPVPSSEPTSTAGPSLSPSPTAAPTTSMEPTFGPSLEPSKAPASSPPATNPLSTPPDADATATTATVLASATTTSSSPSTRSSAASLNSAVLVVALVAANMCLFCGLAWAKRKILAEKLCNYKAPPPLPSSSLSQNDELPYGGLELFRIEVQAPELKEEEEAPHSTIEERLKSHHARLLDTSGAAVINLQSGDGVGTDGGGGGGGRGGGIYHSVSNDDIDIEDDVTATSKTAGVLSTPQQPVSGETLPGARTVGDGKKGHHEPTLAEKIAARKAAVEHSRHHDEPEVEDEHRLHAEKGSTAQREAMKESRSKSKGSSSSLASAASAVAAKAKAAAAVAPGKSQKELLKERIASHKNKTPIEGSSSTSSTSSSSSSNASSRASTSSSTSSSNASPMLGRKGSNIGSSSKAPNPAPPRGRALSSAKTKAVTTQKKEEQKTALAMRRKMEINAKRPSSSSTKKYEEI